MTNFLVYHELEKAPPPGEKKRAIKRKRSETDFDDADPKASQRAILEDEWTDDDRRLMGSPQDNYGWKVGGLVKKTYSFDFRGASHHIISYFNPEDVRTGELKRPIHCREFEETFIRNELVEQGARSRNPVTEAQIEQQRWERPLYQNDSSVSLMRQYPLQAPMSFVPPPQPMDYPSGRRPMTQNHNLVHRSSIHFPMEGGMFNATADPAYQQLTHPSAHVRHSSMSTTITDGFQRAPMREPMVRGVVPLNPSPEAHFQPTPIHHARNHSIAVQSPPDAKPATIYAEEDLHDPTYSTVPQQRASYTIASPPMAMPTLDTSYSHSISRPPLYQGPHSTTDIHPPVNLHMASAPPPLKRSRIETSYPNFSSIQWEQALSAPTDPNNLVTEQAHFTGTVSMEPNGFVQPTTGFTGLPGVTYSHAQDHKAYGDLGAAFAVSQTQAIFAPPAYSGYSQLTAPS